jgi:hypothetical protein
MPAETGWAGPTSKRLQPKTIKKKEEKMNLIMILPPFYI